jgi:hypothetical protein
MKVLSVRIAYWDSYLDRFKHWHVEPGCVVEVGGSPKVPKAASEIVTFDLANIPEMTFWPHAEFLELVREHIHELTVGP